MTRALLRDAVRRGLGQVPPVDTGAGVVGAQPIRSPWPKNAGVNMYLDFAVADMSRKSRMGGDALPRMIPIPAQTGPLPFAINLQSFSPPMHATDVKRVAWYDETGTNETRLMSTSRQAMDWRERISSMNVQPGTPYRYWVESSNIVIWPAPLSAGTLSLMLGMCLWSESQNLDGEVPEHIPVDHYPLLINKAVKLICATQLEDEVLQQIAAAAAQEIARQEPDWLTFCATRDRSHEGRFVPRRLRSGLMMGRR